MELIEQEHKQEHKHDAEHVHGQGDDIIRACVGHPVTNLLIEQAQADELATAFATATAGPVDQAEAVQAGADVSGHVTEAATMTGAEYLGMLPPGVERDEVAEAMAEAAADVEAFFERAMLEYDEHAARAKRIEEKLDRLLKHFGEGA